MLRIKISSCREDSRQRDKLLRIAGGSDFGRVELTDSYDNADLILCTDLHHANLYADLLSVKEHSIFYDKVICYYEMSNPPEEVPGIYACGSKERRGTRGGIYYFWLTDREQPKIRAFVEEDRDLLYSFMGRRGNSIRDAIIDSEVPQYIKNRVILEDTTLSYPLFNAVGRSASSAISDQRDRYFEVMDRSKFVLAPRGAGKGSIRFFEAMGRGAVPVLISDNLELPMNVEWATCSVTVREEELDFIPRLLQQTEVSWKTMSENATAVYGSLFSEGGFWDHLVTSMCDIYANGLESRVSLTTLKRKRAERAARRAAYQGKVRLIRLISRVRNRAAR